MTVRRLHDIGRSGWWVLLQFGSYSFVLSGLIGLRPRAALTGMGELVAYVLLLAVLIFGAILLLFMVQRGTQGSNDYGPDPYGVSDLEEVFA